MTTLLPGDFTFNNINSATLANSKIQLRPEIPVPVRKSAFISVPGVSGDYLLDENAYENTSFTLELICKVGSEVTGTISAMREKIAYTFDSGGYVPLELYFDPDRTYYVKTTSGPNFRLSGEWPDILLYSVELSVKPFKYFNTKYNISRPSGGVTTATITNNTNYPSKPKITLTGTGNMTLTIKSKTYTFQGVDGSLVVDSEIGEAYKIISGVPTNRNNKMYTRDFPILEPGANTISYTGATGIQVEGRWVTLVG